MDINDTTPLVSYTATAGQTAFIIPFNFFAAGNIKVERNGTLITQSVTPSTADQYSVSGAGSDSGGAIALGAGATLNDKIVIYRDITVERTQDIPSAGPFQVGSLNTELATLIAIAQETIRELDRSVRAPLDETGYTMRPQSELEGKTLKVSGQSIIANQADGAAEGALTIQSENTSTSYTLVASDAYTALPFNNASAITVTVPPSSSVPFDTGAWMEFYQVGAGAITFAAGAGVTLRASGNRLTSGGQNSVCAIRYAGSNVWYVAGDRA